MLVLCPRLLFCKLLGRKESVDLLYRKLFEATIDQDRGWHGRWTFLLTFVEAEVRLLLEENFATEGKNRKPLLDQQAFMILSRQKLFEGHGMGFEH